MRKIILQTLLPWSRRQPPEAGVTALDARAGQTSLSTEVLRQAARLLTGTQYTRGSAEQQVQFFCQALMSPSDSRRGVFVLYADVPHCFGAVGLPLFEAIADLISSALSQAAHQQRLEMAARTDGLTGLFNRGHGRQTMQSLRSQPALLPLGLPLLDVDHFKRINDLHGHAAGDAVLRSCADRLRGNLRHLDGLARWGGEEFVVWLPHTPLPQALAVAEKPRIALAAVGHPVGRALEELAVMASIGVTEIRPSEGLDAALARADRAMYLAKDGGRNRVETLDGAFAEPAHAAAPATVDVGATSV